MKTIWKRNVVAAAVLVTVCAGIYVNWLYTEDQAANLTDKLDADKILASDTLVIGDEIVLTDENSVSDYFSAVRLSRQQARDNAVGLLQEAMAYNNETDAQTASGQLEEIVQTALSEAQIESLIIAKGYADCVAYISEDGISVAVATPEGGLQEADVAVIADVVVSQSNLSMEDIHVVEVQ